MYEFFNISRTVFMKSQAVFVGFLALVSMAQAFPAEAGRGGSSSSSSSSSSSRSSGSSFGSSSRSSTPTYSAPRSAPAPAQKSAPTSAPATVSQPVPQASTKPTPAPIVSTPAPKASVSPSVTVSSPTAKPTLAPSLGKGNFGKPAAFGAGVGIGSTTKNTTSPNPQPTVKPQLSTFNKSGMNTAKLTPVQMLKEKIPAGTTVVNSSTDYFKKPVGSSGSAFRYREPISVAGRSYRPIVVQRPIYVGGRYIPYGFPVYEYYPPTPWYTPWYTPQPVYYYNSDPGNSPAPQTLQPLEATKDESNWLLTSLSWLAVIGGAGGSTWLLYRYFQNKIKAEESKFKF
jgi:hypothetical protein